MALDDKPSTDDRLRSGLDTNQADRERMCLALLPLLGKYTFPDPRRPRGGPDGSRDMEAIYDEGLIVWGAVGFQNGASDSPEQKKWVASKFKGDLEAALKRNKNLKGFAFFTNVDLTPGEIEDLKKHAVKMGLTHIAIFARERLRSVLDSTDGLGYRLQYLGLSMSPEQQLQFVKRFEQSITDALEKHRVLLDGRLQRLEFLQMAAEPLYEVSVICSLKRSISTTALGHFRASVQFIAVRDGYLSNLNIIARNGHNPNDLPDAVKHLVSKVSVESRIWSDDEKPRIKSETDVRFFRRAEIPEIVFGPSQIDQQHEFTLRHLNRRLIAMHVTEPLAKEIERVYIVVNGYLVLSANSDAFTFSGVDHFDTEPIWRGHLSKAEKSISWVQIDFGGAQTFLDFTFETPPVFT